MPAVADMQRPGRIGRDEFQQHFAACARCAVAVAAALLQKPAQFGMKGLSAHREIDESRPRHFGLCDQHRSRQRGHQSRGYLARGLLKPLGEAHSDIACKMAVHRVARPLDVDRRELVCADARLLQHIMDRGFEQIVDFSFHRWPHSNRVGG